MLSAEKETCDITKAMWIVIFNGEDIFAYKNELKARKKQLELEKKNDGYDLIQIYKKRR